LIVPGLSPEELQAVIDKLDEVCRQAQELQEQLRKQMVERARRDQPARSAASPVRRRPHKPSK
jgi:hypothetical protein